MRGGRHGSVRIGDKLVSRHKIIRVVDAILELRAQGASQQDVAAEFNTDRALSLIWKDWVRFARRSFSLNRFSDWQSGRD